MSDRSEGGSLKQYLLKSISMFLIVCLISGCTSTRTINFSSSPSRASVIVGTATCTTPCKLELPVNTPTAKFILASGENREVSIEQITKPNAETRYRLSKAGEVGSIVTATPFLVIGGLGLLLTGLFESDTIKTDHSSRDEGLALVAVGSALVGFLFVSAGKLMGENAKELEPEIHVWFSQPVPESTPVKSFLNPNNNGALKLFPESLPSPTTNQLK